MNQRGEEVSCRLEAIRIKIPGFDHNRGNHWVKKEISPQGKHKGNHKFTNNFHGFYILETTFFYVVFFDKKNPTLRLTCTCFHCMETRVNQWFSHMEDRGNHKKNRVSQCKHKGNHIETSRFPHVNIRETTWTSHISHCFTQIGNYCIPVSRIHQCGNSGKFRFPRKKSVGNHMEIPGFQQVSP